MRHDNYDAVMAADVDLLKHPVVSTAVGTAAMAVDVAAAAYHAAEKLPVFGSLMRRGVASLSERGDSWVDQSAEQFKALVTTMAADAGWLPPRWHYTTVEDTGTGQAEAASRCRGSIAVIALRPWLGVCWKTTWRVAD